MKSCPSLETLLSKSKSLAVKRMLDRDPGPFSPSETAEIEMELLKEAPPGSDHEILFAAAAAVIYSIDPEWKGAGRPRVAFRYPSPRNPLVQGFREAEGVRRAAVAWLNSDRPAIGDGAQAAKALFARFIVASILEFGIGHAGFIPAIVDSLKNNRKISLNRFLFAIPVSLPYRQQDHAEERLLIIGGTAASLLRRFLAHPRSGKYLHEVAERSMRRNGIDLSRAIEGVITLELGSEHLQWSMAELIRASSQMSILALPAGVAAHRNRVTVSHALRLDVLARLGSYRIPPFSEGSLASKPEPDGGESTAAGERQEPGPEHLWKIQLRAAVKKDVMDLSLLQAMAHSEEMAGRRMGEYALYLSTRLLPSSVYRFVFLIANRLMPRFGNSDPMELDEDSWEEAVQQVLDEDAFFHRSPVDQQVNTAGYSGSLLKALRHFVLYVGRGTDNLAHIKRMLPSEGLVNVNASIVTVDEFKSALSWLSGPEVYPDSHLIKASRAALILGFRLGLRQAETAFLRIDDFDARNRLHVRPWFLRKLKTSNARRDLPLEVLMPKEELDEILELVQQKREYAGQNANDALLFSRTSEPSKPMNFERILEQVHASFRTRRKQHPAIPQFHYHLLRHSFANICLLRLWSPLHGIARQVLRNHPETLDWICDTERFRIQLFGTTQVRGADLQAIAHLMGHGSSATTIEHYLHVLDWYRVR